MLSNSSSNLSSVLEASEGVQVLQQKSGEQTRPATPAFPSPRGENEEKETRDELSTEETDSTGQEDDVPGICQITVNKDFQEILDRFLTCGHERIFSIRSEIRRDRGLSRSFLSWHNARSANFDLLRNKLYQVQMHFFRSPKGTKYDLSL
ncbi:hypothetical protein NC796_16935 [Aliifodinibius sp. S!AR15-10]|uniref:hypothetical protein n=1 Tax=Aliifodinibius sp. S!AR15-10 TaxID=2950437 RepID=UPI002854E652|nr:hypothetical protein [Aliifodinibius sp. S!AR15-10]MDR8392844.1 hypothetical protein [Aliifodinibius sp. S!AR15-10]